MANIVSTSETKIFQIKSWLGLNESPDGDTHMKLGEAAEMRNFRITAENHLQIRPGYGPICTLAEGSPIKGMWSGYVKGVFHVVAACGGHLWDIDVSGKTATDKGEIDESATFFFGFSEKLYILTGAEYYAWDGEGTATVVEGYIPIVTTAAPPQGGGTLLESINLLTGKKRAEYSPDGEATVFQLPENNLDQIISVEGTDISYTSDLVKGTVTFQSAPPKGINTITFTWKKGDGDRKDVTGMRYAELYNGESDSRVFLYGNGTNKTIYSGLDEFGKATAEYFPQLNTISVDAENTPITAMIRHYDRLLIFKPDSAYSCSYSTITLDGGLTTAAFYVSSLNRSIGNEAPGQARLVSNNARTVFGRSVYTWSLASNSVRDERNAKIISDKVSSLLAQFDISKSICFDDEWNQEYYIFYNGNAVVHNYQNDAWYYYTNMPVEAVVSVRDSLYFGTPDGRIMEFSRKYRNDDLKDIDAYWESGSMDFDMDWRRKYSSNIWVSIKPESQAMVYATAESNIKSDYPDKLITAGLATFLNMDFNHWSFGTNRKPQLIRAKLKVKKATYYKLIFYSVSASATATILSADIQVRYTGNVK